MGVFKCNVCGNPAAWNSVWPGGMDKHDCPGPPPEPEGGPAKCAYCKQPDPEWRPADLAAGKRALRPGPGIDYHCTLAFYGAQ
jgi:hypothetical protein